MANGPMPIEGQAAAAPAEEQAQQPGGASELVANINSQMMKLQDMLAAKLPEEAQAMAGIIQAYQGFVEGLGQAPGAPQQEAMPQQSSPEAGGNPNARPAM